MALVFYNPYTVLGQQLKDGLDDLIAGFPAYPPGPTVDELVTAIIAYMGPLYGEETITPVVSLELSMVAGDAINGYINSAAGAPLRYDRQQQEFIFQLLEGIKNVPMISLRERIVNIEENIATSNLTSAQQAPLLMATSVGKAGLDYWLAELADEESPWLDYLDQWKNDSTYLTFEVAATMEGALIGAKLNVLKGSSMEMSDAGGNAISALSAALMLAAGKMVFHWLPRAVTVK